MDSQLRLEMERTLRDIVKRNNKWKPYCKMIYVQCIVESDAGQKEGTMKIHYYILIVFIGSSVWAQNKDGDIEFFYGFLQGTYKIIGKAPDSNQTYTGKVILKIEGGRLQVIRKIGSKEIKGIGTIEIATADEIKVLRVRFRENDKNYEVTYIIDSDLDN